MARYREPANIGTDAESEEYDPSEAELTEDEDEDEEYQEPAAPNNKAVPS
jgi:hypothetical protein